MRILRTEEVSRLGSLKPRYPRGMRVLVRRANASLEDAWEELYVWSVRRKGKLLCLTFMEPGDPEFPSLRQHQP